MSAVDIYYGTPYVTARYGPRSGGFHGGDDFAHPANTAVPSITGGEVVAAGPDPMGKLGNRVVIQQGSVRVVYGHLADRLNVREGQRIDAGSVLGFVGDPGNASVLGEWDGPHTHLQTEVNGQVMDPTHVLANLPHYSSVSPGPTGGSPTTEQQAIAQAGAKAAKKYNVPQGVVLGTLYAENGLKSQGGNNGGPGQVIATTAAQYGVTQEQLRADPNLAADVTAHILADNYRQFGDWEKAVGAYYAGPLNIINQGSNYKSFVPPNNKASVGDYISSVKDGNAYATSILTGDNQATSGIGPAVVGSGPHVGGAVGAVGNAVTAVPDAATSVAKTIGDFFGLITNSKLWWSGGFIVGGAVLVLVGGIMYLSSFKEVQQAEQTAVKDAAIA